MIAINDAFLSAIADTLASDIGPDGRPSKQARIQATKILRLMRDDGAVAELSVELGESRRAPDVLPGDILGLIDGILSRPFVAESIRIDTRRDYRLLEAKAKKEKFTGQKDVMVKGKKQVWYYQDGRRVKGPAKDEPAKERKPAAEKPAKEPKPPKPPVTPKPPKEAKPKAEPKTKAEKPAKISVEEAGNALQQAMQSKVPLAKEGVAALAKVVLTLTVPQVKELCERFGLKKGGAAKQKLVDELVAEAMAAPAHGAAARQAAASKQLDAGQAPLPAGFRGEADEKADADANALAAGAKWARGYKLDLAGKAKQSIGNGKTREQFLARFQGKLKPVDAKVVGDFYDALARRSKTAKPEKKLPEQKQEPAKPAEKPPGLKPAEKPPEVKAASQVPPEPSKREAGQLSLVKGGGFDLKKDTRSHAEKVPKTAYPADITKEEREAIKWYTSGNFSAMNKVLREGWRPLTPEQTRNRTLLRGLFDRIPPFDTPVLVNRGITLDKDKTGRFLDMCKQSLTEGGTVTLKGYSSTTTGEALSNFRGNVEMVIAARKGLNCVHDAALGEYESELLLDEDTRVRVIHIKKVGKVYQVHMEHVL